MLPILHQQKNIMKYQLENFTQYQEIRKSTNHLLQGGHLLSKPWFSEKRETGKSINEILLVSTIKYQGRQGRLLTATKLSKPSIDGGLIFSTLAVIKETK